ncbi:hypothetical protein CBS101457_001585 [Exobasidium rhododendri]|nr:hypothetical protein CBS101457_001585 [Exobasidium rhododendri]
MSSSNEPSQLSGQAKSVYGTVEEVIGNVTGSANWQASGKKDHAEGEAEVKAAQAKGYAEGLTDQVGGYKDSIVGAVTGDQAKQTEGNVRNQAGEAKKNFNAPS